MDKFIEFYLNTLMVFCALIAAIITFAFLIALMYEHPISMAFATLVAISIGMGWWLTNE